MKELTFDHVFDCSEDTYWDKVFFDDEYNHAMFLDALKFSVWRVLSNEEVGDTVHRVVEVVPPVGDVPKAVKKILGDNFGYREEGTFDRKTRRFKVDVKTAVMPDKIHCGGEIWLEPAGEDKCHRKAKFQVEVKIFGVGKVVEGLIARDMEKQFADGSRFTNEWIKKKGW